MKLSTQIVGVICFPFVYIAILAMELYYLKKFTPYNTLKNLCHSFYETFFK